MDRSAVSMEAKASPEQLAEWAEHRAKFWRTRCLEHARTIDQQMFELIDLRRMLAEATSDPAKFVARIQEARSAVEKAIREA